MTQLEGIVKSAKLTGEMHSGPVYKKEKTPIVEIVLENENLIFNLFKMPLDVRNPFEMRLIEKELVGHKVKYEAGTENSIHERTEIVFQKLIVKSGTFEGITYAYQEVYMC